MTPHGIPVTAVTTYSIEAATTPAGVSRARTRGAEVRFATREALSEDLFGPAEVLGAAFAACLLKNVERFSHLLPFRYDAAQVQVDLDREERPPRISRIRYRLVIVTDEPPHRLELLERNLVRFGTIYNTLASACAVSGELVASPSTAAG